MSFLSGMMQQRAEIERLKALAKKLKPARILGVKHCVKCGLCCHIRTCVPTPSELKKIAKFLKLTPKKLIGKYYVIDRMGLGSEVYFVKPAGKNIKDLVGKFIPAERTFDEGACIFLGKDNLCKIYPVRPKMARLTKCWKETKDYNFEKPWRGNQLLKQFGIDGDRKEEEARW